MRCACTSGCCRSTVRGPMALPKVLRRPNCTGMPFAVVAAHPPRCLCKRLATRPVGANTGALSRTPPEHPPSCASEWLPSCKWAAHRRCEPIPSRCPLCLQFCVSTSPAPLCDASRGSHYKSDPLKRRFAACSMPPHSCRAVLWSSRFATSSLWPSSLRSA